MKTKEIAETKGVKEINRKEIPDFTINPELNDKYNDEPLFKEKVAKVNAILKESGIPKF